MKVYQKQPLQCSSYAKRVNIPLRAGAEEGGYLIHFREGEGFLGGGIGSEEVDIGTEAQISAFFRAGQAAAAYAPTGELYAGADMGDTGISFTDIPACLPLPDGEGMLLSDGTACARVSAAGAQSLPLPFRTAVFAYGRLWRTADGVRLYFGAPDDYEEQAEERGKAGYIDCPDAKGKILHLFFVKNEVYVLREYGLQKLTAHGDEEEFAFEDVLSCARVCGGSVVFFQRMTGSSAGSVSRSEARSARGTRSIFVRMRMTRVEGNSSAMAFSTEKQRVFCGGGEGEEVRWRLARRPLRESRRCC